MGKGLVYAFAAVGCSIAVFTQQALSIESLMSAAVIRKRLEPGGYLNSQTTELSLGNKEDHQVRRKALAETGTSPGSDEFQCAICFFGLPRSYKEMVLPNIVKNVLEPNHKYNCDVFVHFDARWKDHRAARKNEPWRRH